MVKLKRLKIEKYRNVKPGTELHFRDSLNVMLGRNGTGKTTLLNLIVQLLSWDFTRLQTETVSLEYVLQTSKVELTVRFRTEVFQESAGRADGARSFSGDMLAMGLVQNSPRYVTTLDVDIIQPGMQPWLLQLEGSAITVGRKGNDPHTLAVTRPLGEHSLFTLVFALCATSSPKAIQELGIAVMSVAEGLLLFFRRFDESLGYLERVIERESISALKSSQGDGHYIAIPNGPLSFASALTDALSENPGREEVRIESRDKGQEFLNRLVELLGFESAHVRIQRIARSAGPDGQLNFGNIQFYFARRDGSIINHSLMSYGQKRLLAFYCYLASNPTCIVADELVNGMHHDWIGACLEDLGERQAFLTSQNPLLLDYLYFESAEEVRSSFVLCRTEIHEGREQMVWENMTEEDAEGFFKAYHVAIQHVSELLRTRGLW